MTIFVLGAGCSKNYSEPVGVPGVTPPVQNDFFGVAASYLEETGLPPHFDTSGLELPNFIEALLNFYCRLEDRPSKTWAALRQKGLQAVQEESVSLEDAMTVLELALTQKGVFRVRDFRDYHFDQLLELVARVLAAAFSAGPCSLHARLAQCIKTDRDKIISFNYDTLIDDALNQHLGSNDARYLVDFSYCREYEAVDQNQEGPKTYRGLRTSPPSFEISLNFLLKLHGSLNWIRCETCSSFELDKGVSGCQSYMSYLYDFLQGDAEFEGIENLIGWAYRQESLGRRDVRHLLAAAKNHARQKDIERQKIIRCLHCGDIMKRVIVPPLASKTHSDPLFARLWIQAADALSLPNDIVVIGYSMPVTDIGSCLLFRANTRTWWPLVGTQSIKLTVVNPNEEDRQRVKRNIAHTECQEYKSLEEFLDAEGV